MNKDTRLIFETYLNKEENVKYRLGSEPDRLVEATVSGPTAGKGPGTTGRAQYLKVLDKVKDRGSTINPDDRNMPRVWDVEPGEPLPNKQVFIVDNRLGVQVTFSPEGKSRSGRIVGAWILDRVWNLPKEIK